VHVPSFRARRPIPEPGEFETVLVKSVSLDGSRLEVVSRQPAKLKPSSH